MTKSDREIMEILEAFDLTRCGHSAAVLSGVDEKTVARYVAIRDAGRDPLVKLPRPRSIDPFMGKIKEWVDKSQGRVRADVVHQRLAAMGFTGTDRSTRRAVVAAKRAWNSGHRRAWCERVNARPHRETGVAPVARLSIEREHLHVLPDEPHAIVLGEERLVGDDQTIRWGSVRYSTPDGHQGAKVWCRVAGRSSRHCR
ncbi:hypothetical protein ABIA39_002971 [Nocardia sp. GAS34]|uniref:hypothetical protein n=1 Tax=unclassified Nocardia TaxID=2637762 RepID=UPI003D1E4E62